MTATDRGGSLVRNRRTSVIPVRLEEARRRFERWRETRKLRRIPEELWSLAAALAKEHGVHRTARVLRLNDDSLRKRLATMDGRSPARSAKAASFVELVAGPIVTAAETTIELEDGSGRKLRIHLEGGGTPDLGALATTFWGGQR